MSKSKPTCPNCNSTNWRPIVKSLTGDKVITRCFDCGGYFGVEECDVKK